MIVKVTVIKSFPYGADGIHVVQTVVGDEIDIGHDLVDGLVKEGFVEYPRTVRRPRSRSAG